MTQASNALIVAFLVGAAGANAQGVMGPPSESETQDSATVGTEAPQSGTTEVVAPQAAPSTTGGTAPDPAAGEVFAQPDVSAGDDAALPDVRFDPLSGVAPANDDGSFAQAQAAAESSYAERWQALYDDGNYPAAAQLGQLWVMDAQRTFGDGSAETFVPLSRLGAALTRAGKAAPAETALRDAVIVAERRIGAFAPELVQPLVSLGQALNEQGRLDDAVSALLRAKDITHRNQGIFNIEQSAIIDDLTESYVGLGQIQQANREQRFSYAAHEKKYGNSPELVPALQKWAQWNVRMQRFADARRSYHRALDILEETYGPNDLRLIETLNMVARSFYRNTGTTFPREGAKALQRAVQIYQSQGLVDQADLMKAQTRLGDWYMLSGARSRSLDAYQAAVRTAEEAGLDKRLVDGIYGQPRPLQSSNLPVGVLGSRLAKLAGPDRHILVEFNVDKRGRTRDIRIIEDTVGLVSVARDIRDRIAVTAFRPRFEDGEPVVTQGVRMFFEFEVAPGVDIPSENAGSARREATPRSTLMTPGRSGKEDAESN